MKILENISLKSYNTFGIDVNARYFSEINKDEEIYPFLGGIKPERKPLLILGGGSNILFTKDFPGTVLKISTKGIRITEEDENYVVLQGNAGEDWDSFVQYSVEKGWGGLENLSLIPGNVGTCPVQNIGAYGVEIKDVFVQLEGLFLDSGERKIFTKEDCGFGYRESIFKRHLKDHFVILNVSFRLQKRPSLCLEYGMIKEELARRKIQHPDLLTVREAICTIRKAKLPDPAKIGNAGSFFKNPVIPVVQFNQILNRFPDIVYFPQDNMIKLAAAWLIEQCGWKGRRIGNTGVHSSQPLVLVNYGNASGKEIWDLGSEVQRTVYEKFGILLETEVNII